ncbi:universal stress protein [Natronobacterium texcoconense]|uniref:Nucleotide-binding universal stress protein, UspA family n=1 Tax=Natronobacterium texcoconense TaxID=1095778 RepID=A0A1H1HTJ4_NATTX|nr:universal stress protein [Natronobacterium texcoconense]SDR28744.1 Nucleotide-binding universal stress protein, UspA family [Natronobacterium texcoconense]
MIDPDHVLVPTLDRPNEDEALAYALETFPDADVTLLAVVTPLDAPLSEGGVLERDDDRSTQARRRSRELLASVDQTSVEDRVRIETVEGRPGNAVPKYASDEEIDHVVMYGHGVETSGFMRRFLGRGIAATVVERTSEPVTVLE